MLLTLQPQLLRWARVRAGFDPEVLAKMMGTKTELLPDAIVYARVQGPAK